MYCYQERGHDRFSETDYAAFLAHVEEFLINDGDTLWINYFGGEPLLERATLLSLDSGLKKLALRYGANYTSSISTNGSLINLDLVKRVKFNKIRLTFDGDEEWHRRLKRPTGFSYNDQLSLINQILDETNAGIVVRLNVCAENADSLKRAQEDVCALGCFDAERVSFEYAKMRNHFSLNDFRELTQREFSYVVLRLTLAAKERGVLCRLPHALSLPCPFSVGKAVCVGPGMKRLFCSESADGLEDVTGLGLIPHPIFLKRECRCCSVLPLCLGGCALMPGESGCIPERYVLVDLLCDAIRNPQDWVFDE